MVLRIFYVYIAAGFYELIAQCNISHAVGVGNLSGDCYYLT